MLARIAHELYWLGRQPRRAPSTPRACSTASSTPTCRAAPTTPASTRLSWDALLAIMGADSERAPADRDDVVRAADARPATTRRRSLSCVARAREGARTVRDVFSAEMWEAINTFHLGLLRRDISAALRTGPYSVYAYVKERCALFWGVTDRTMLRDEARAFLEAGARDRGRRHGAADAARRAADRRGRAGEADPRDGQALALLQAVGGFQAFRRAVPAPPNAEPGRRASCSTSAPTRTRSRASVDALHDALTRGRRRATATPRRCCG